MFRVYFIDQYKDCMNDSSRWRGVSSSVGMAFISCVCLSDVCDDTAAGCHHQGPVLEMVWGQVYVISPSDELLQ